MFDDDWEASTYIYPRRAPDSPPSPNGDSSSRPPITLLVIAVGGNIIFDPAKEELAVAEVALAVSVAEATTAKATATGKGKGTVREERAMEVDSPGREIRLLSVRTIDPPSRLTPPGVPNFQTAAALGSTPAKQTAPKPMDSQNLEGVWRPPLGGAKFAVLAAMIQKVLEKGGVADEVLDGLEDVELT
jgi:exosome complex component RRP42